MPGSLGGGAIMAFAAALWLLVLAPSWVRRKQYLDTERTAVRLQQTLRILAETADVPDEVRAEVSARSVADQHRALREAARRAESAARPRQAAAERSLKRRSTPPPREPAQRAAAVSAVTRSRLRRTRIVGSLALVGAMLVAGYGGLRVLEGGPWIPLVGGVVGAFAAIALLQRVSTAAAAQRAVTAVDHAVAVPEAPQTFVDWQRDELQRPTWTPVPIPKPLYLDRDEAARVATADPAAALARAARDADESLRAALAADEVATIDSRRAKRAADPAPAQGFAAMGVVGDTEPVLRDLDAVLRRRRVS